MKHDLRRLGRNELYLVLWIVKVLLAYAWLRSRAATVAAAVLRLAAFPFRRRVHWIGATEPVETRPR